MFFGEGLPESYHNSINSDKKNCDLLIVIGSSLKVKPVANIPHLIGEKVPQILINRESLGFLNFDIELLGDCDLIIKEVLLRLKDKEESIFNKNSNLNQSYNFDWCDIFQKEETNLKPLEKLEDQYFEKKILQDHILNKTLIDQNIKTGLSVTKSDSNVNDSKIRYSNEFLKENSFFHIRPNIYVFQGAEIDSTIVSKKIKKLRELDLRKSTDLIDLTCSSDEENYEIEDADQNEYEIRNQNNNFYDNNDGSEGDEKDYNEDKADENHDSHYDDKDLENNFHKFKSYNDKHDKKSDAL